MRVADILTPSTSVGVPSQSPHCCMEWPVKEAQIGTHAGLSARQAAQTYPTPAEILAQIGCVVAFCLGLALLAHVIVAFVGTQ